MASPVFIRFTVMYIIMSIVLSMLFWSSPVVFSTPQSQGIVNATKSTVGAINSSSSNQGIFNGIFLVGTVSSSIINGILDLQPFAKIFILLAVGTPNALAGILIAMGGLIQVIFDVIFAISVISFIRG